MKKRVEVQQPNRLSVQLSLTDIAEAMMQLRREMSQLLRDEAERVWQESPEQSVVDMSVRQALHRVADAFEVGLSRADAREEARRRA